MSIIHYIASLLSFALFTGGALFLAWRLVETGCPGFATIILLTLLLAVKIKVKKKQQDSPTRR